MLKKAMKILPFLAALILLAVFFPKNAHAASPVKISAANFPEQAFRDAAAIYDNDSDGYLSEDELQFFDYLSLDDTEITTLKGIELLPHLAFISAADNKLKSVDLSGNPGLTYLNLSGNSLTSIDLSANPLLEQLYLCDNKLSSIDLSDKHHLTTLDVEGNKLKSLSLYGTPVLNQLHCARNQLTSLSLVSLQYLDQLDCSSNQLTALNLSSNPEITSLSCCENQLTALDLSTCRELQFIDVSNNSLKSLDLTLLPQLTDLWVNGNELSVLNITKNPKLGILNVYDNKLTSLNISACPTLCYTYETGVKEDMGDAWSYEAGDSDHWDLGYYFFVFDKNVRIKSSSADLAAPTLTAANKPQQIELKWKKVSGADSYELWRMTQGGAFEKLKTTTGTAYNDKGAKPGVVYIYRVRAMSGTKSGPYSAAKSVTRNPFSDVSEANSFFGAVMWAVRNNVASGTTATTFSPADTCARYQFTVMLYRYLDKPEAPESLPFTDVPASASYYSAVTWAYSNGIISGTTKTTFSPYAEIKRYQVVQMLYKFAGKPDVETTVNPFKDVSKKASYYKAVLWAVENGITAGTSKTTFSPDAPCQRYQMAVFLRKLNQLYQFKPL